MTELPALREIDLLAMSKVEVKYLVAPSRESPSLRILIVKYSGDYRFASAGNPDATYMRAMATAGITICEPVAVIHDLSELSYSWGDMLGLALGVGMENDRASVALVVGPKCEEAVRTLCLGEDSSEPLESIEGVFRDLPSAWDYVEKYIERKFATPPETA